MQMSGKPQIIIPYPGASHTRLLCSSRIRFPVKFAQLCLNPGPSVKLRSVITTMPDVLLPRGSKPTVMKWPEGVGCHKPTRACERAATTAGKWPAKGERNPRNSGATSWNIHRCTLFRIEDADGE
ncbi:hypothetical protein KM043_013616 [Ampulex compressa]|nr:hypothetical protein KM043_013616 [Ampulex compressa]